MPKLSKELKIGYFSINKFYGEKIIDWKGPLKSEMFPGLPTLSRNPNPLVEKNSVFVSSFKSKKILLLNRRTGGVLWKFDLGVYGGVSLHVDLTSIYAGTYKGVCAVNKKTGKLRWSYEPYSPDQESFYSEPIKADGNILIADRYGYLHNLNPKNGKIKYRTLLISEGATDSINTNVAVFSKKIYAISTKGQLTCVDLTSGKVIWTKFLEEGSIRPPIISENKIYIQGNSNVYVLALKTDRVKKIEFDKVVDIAIKNKFLFVLDEKKYSPSKSQTKTTLYKCSEKKEKICDFSKYISGFTPFKDSKIIVVLGTEEITFFDLETKVKKLKIKGIFSALPFVTRKKIYAVDLMHEVISIRNPL